MTGAIMIEHTTGGQGSLAKLAEQHKSQPSAILRLTAQHSPGGAFPANVAAYLNGVFTAPSLPPIRCRPDCTSTCRNDPQAAVDGVISRILPS
jgi:hypothetical protein